MRASGARRAKITLLDDGSLSSASAKAERLKRVRNLANLSREEFCADGNVNVTTLISWEVGRFGGLSRKGAASVITRVAKEGVFVTPEWLLHEIGAGPEVCSDYKKIAQHAKPELVDTEITPDDARIIEELSLFRKLNKNSIDFAVIDDAMLPHYQAGDYVAGTRRTKDKIKLLIGFDCIAQLSDGRMLLRNIQSGPRENTFNLVATNFKSKAKDLMLHDVEVVCAAPVIWHRRKEPAV